MICEGRILQKSEGRKTSIGVSMWKILDAMNYNRRLMISKRDYDIILSKEDSEYDFFDKKDPAPLIQIYSYVDIKEIFIRKSRKQGLETFFRFPDNGYTFRKYNIDAIYNMPEPDVGWIYKNPDTYDKSKH